MSSILNELPIALRRLSRAPGFSLTVVSFLSLAIAALLAMAAVGYGLLWRPFGIPDDDRVVAIDGWSKQMQSSLGLSGPLAAELAQSLPELATGGVWERATGGDARVPAGLSAGALEALGVQPILGRAFEPADAVAADVVLVSEDVWRSDFAASPDVLARTMQAAGKERRIIGVMPKDFRFPDAATKAWQPLELAGDDLDPKSIQSFSGLQYVARLRPGVSVANFVDAVRQRYGDDARLAAMREFLGLDIRALALRDQLAGDKRELAKLLAAAAALLVATTLANLANLWLGRALARQRELGIASALGASSARLGAGVFAEVLVLTFVATGAGLALAPACIGGLRLAGVLDPGSPLRLGLDVPLACFAGVTAILLAAMLAAPSWWLARRLGTTESLRQGTAVVAERPSVGRVRHGLIAVQVAVAVALLGGGGLMLRSLSALLAEGTGFDRDGLVLLQASGPLPADVRAWDDVATARAAVSVREFHARLLQQPGIRVSFSNAPPFSGSEMVSKVRPAGLQAGEEHNARTRSVGPAYFETLGLPLLAGRTFDAAELRGDVSAVVVDARFAAKWFPGDTALGRDIGVRGGGKDEYRAARIVGVVPDVKQARLDDRDDDGTVYSARESTDGVGVRFILRSQRPLADLRAIAEREAKATGVRIERLATVDSIVWDTLRERTSLLTLLGVFAAFGTALSALGLYAVLAFAARRRTPEFGLKLALGASSKRIASDVLRQAFALVLPGMALGAFAAVAAGRAIASQLYGVSPADAVTWAAVSALVALLVLLAAALPARRAASVDPMLTLRQD